MFFAIKTLALIITSLALADSDEISSQTALRGSDPKGFEANKTRKKSKEPLKVSDLKGMNVIVFITDQDREIQHFPPGWAEKNLPGLQQLKKHGLTFKNAFCNSCMCSPARATLMTGLFPAQHGVKWTLEDDMSPSQGNPQQVLPEDLPNLATIMAAAGYSSIFKGKFHLTKPGDGSTVYKPEDLARYGFQRWNPPEGGADQSPGMYGGGYANNDGRFMNSKGYVEYGQEGVLSFLRSESAKESPFFLIVSLVNPHDVLGYPNTGFYNGYDPNWLKGDIGLPETVVEDLSTKPSAQTQFLNLFNLGNGNLDSPDMQKNYLNFYGNLLKSSDKYLVQMLSLLRKQRMLDNTLIIRTSDHGEMGLAHNGLRQKNFNFYEETLRVPLIFSNPRLYPSAVETYELVSQVDIAPTLSALFPSNLDANFAGVDFSSLVLNSGNGYTQDYTVFTFDDYQGGQKDGPYPGPNRYIVSIREAKYKLAKYYSNVAGIDPEWEMYNLEDDPFEVRNIAWPGANRTAEEEFEFMRLQEKLNLVINTRLQPL